jgi:RNA polymerase sigma factor (sigma-70 family)
MNQGDKYQDDKFKERREKHQAQWEIILMDYYLRLLGFARFVLQNNSNAVLKRNYEPEDLVNDTVERILHYSVNPEDIKNKWAYQKRILQNRIVDLSKKIGKMPTDSIDDENYSEAEMPVENPNPLKNLENEEMRKVLAQVTHDLSDIEKQIFRLYLKGHSRKEIAEILKRDVKVVRHVLNAVKVKIKYRIEH